MSEREITFKERFLFALNGFPDLMTYQFFSVTIFVFYYTVVGISTFDMWLGYVIWGIWNMFNDPLLGYISDKKKYGKYGKRKLFILIAFIPLSLIMIFLYTVPIQAVYTLRLVYFIVIIIIFELIYTLFDVNVKSLFPEMWVNEQERAKTNIVLRILTIFALLAAFIIPSFVIPDVGVGAPVSERANAQFFYILSGSIIAIVAGVTAFLFVFFGIKEKEETIEQFEKRPSFFKSLKITFKNRNFVVLVLANMMTWYVLQMLTAMYALYVKHVLVVTSGIFLYYGLSITLAFIVAALVMPIHKKIGLKYGMRKGFMITMVVMLVTFIPFTFYGPNEISRIIAVVNAALIGFGISGIMFYFDILMGAVIDEDAKKTGTKRSASFYGTNAFVHRFSIILFISSVYLVFQYTAWEKEYTETALGADIGLRVLIGIFTAIACVIAFILMYFFKTRGKTQIQET